MYRILTLEVPRNLIRSPQPSIKTSSGQQKHIQNQIVNSTETSKKICLDFSSVLSLLMAWNRSVQSGRWHRKRSRHSRCMRNPQFYVSGKRPIIWSTTSITSIIKCAYPFPKFGNGSVILFHTLLGVLLISWLLMPWRRKEPGHQQPWYCIIYP